MAWQALTWIYTRATLLDFGPSACKAKMQVAAGQDGIQRLLAAEKEAQQIVAKARKGNLVFERLLHTLCSPAKRMA